MEAPSIYRTKFYNNAPSRRPAQRKSSGRPGYKGKPTHLPLSSPSCQFPPAAPGGRFNSDPAQGGNMNEFKPWTQNDWYALGSLLTQLAFLFAGVWFARNILRTMRAFQEQAGALLKLSITRAPGER